MIYTFDPEKATEKLVYRIQRWFSEYTNNADAVIGSSYTLDCMVTTALCAKALGLERVKNVIATDTFDHWPLEVRKYFDEAGTQQYVIPIGGAVDDLIAQLSNAGLDPWQSVKELEAKMEMIAAYMVADSVHGKVAGMCNLSEWWVGDNRHYGSCWGDFYPLLNLTFGEVKAIAKVLKLPEQLLNALDSLHYIGLDHYIRTGECEESARRAFNYRHLGVTEIQSFLPMFDLGLPIKADMVTL